MAIADGFYEWKREEKVKTPYYFLREDKILNAAHVFQKNSEFHLAKPSLEDF